MSIEDAMKHATGMGVDLTTRPTYESAYAAHEGKIYNYGL
jgi:hypothetical protein